MSDEQPIFLFSYGTLQQPEVQQALFGRVLDTHLDVLPGHALSWLHITNLAVIAQSGRDRHPILTPSPEPHAAVTGSVMRLTSAELEQADRYEVDDYHRVSVTLASGRQSWVYLQRPPTTAG